MTVPAEGKTVKREFPFNGIRRAFCYNIKIRFLKIISAYPPDYSNSRK